jgi:hypothetical protein
MFVCGLRVFISCHVALLDRGGSIKEGHFGFRHFVCEFYRWMDTVGMFQKFNKLFIAMCPLHVNVPSHIKDTTDYLKKMENLTIPENTTLVTMDVASLYTNIPHDDGIAACRKIWEQRTD